VVVRKASAPLGPEGTAAPAPVVDGLAPARTEAPSSPDHLARLLCEAATAEQAVVPVGGGRLLGMGDPLERFDLALETQRLNRVLDASQADMVVTVEAGATLEQLNEELAKGGQFLPLDPMGGPGHTIGGLLATGLSGPLRLRYGSARDNLIGLRVALPDGKLARSGGKVVKNVSGYDMNKLHLGALGALGVIVEAAFKVYPLPLHELTLSRQARDPEAAWDEVARALGSKMQPVALVLEGGRVHARLAGSRAAVERVAAELAWDEGEPGFWKTLSERRSDFWARISVPDETLRDVLGRLPEDAQWIAYPGLGTAHWMNAATADSIVSAREAAEAASGSLVLVSAPAELKRKVGAWGRRPPTADLMSGIRDAFDPGRSISPGRFLV
jgi:glycolate oxidase FAD binding subunit